MDVRAYCTVVMTRFTLPQADGHLGHVQFRALELGCGGQFSHLLG